MTKCVKKNKNSSSDNMNFLDGTKIFMFRDEPVIDASTVNTCD